MSESQDSPGDVRATIIAALRDPRFGGDPLARLCHACVRLLPVDGASIAALTALRERETLCCSDGVSARLDELQYTLGEGPGFDAFDSGSPVLVPDLAAVSAAWPVFTAEASRLPVGAIYSFPIRSGAIIIGALDLYRQRSSALTVCQVRVVLHIVDVGAALLLTPRRTGKPQNSPRTRWWRFLLREQRFIKPPEC